MMRMKLFVVLACLAACFDVASAASLTAFTVDADVYALSIKPERTTVGAYPEIIGYIKNKTNSNIEKASFYVQASVFFPNKTQKAWAWSNVLMLPDQSKSFALGKSFDLSSPGTYKVEYAVYNIEKTRLISSRSRSFVVSSLAGTQATPPPVTAAAVATKPTRTMAPVTPAPLVRSRKAVAVLPPKGTSAYTVGVGGYVNTANFSGGPTLILWPLKNVALQGSYGVGTFTSWEIRGLYRFVPASFPGIRPYVGAGYLYVEREFKETEQVTGITLEGTISGSSGSLFAGVEIPFLKDRLVLAVDISGTPLKLEEDVLVNSNTMHIKADYNPVTLNVGLVYYLW